MFNPKDWYWHVAGDAANVLSSARNIYVPTSDSDYAAWLTSNGMADAPSVPDEADIYHYVSDFLPLYLWDGANFSQPAAGQYSNAQLQNYNGTARLNKVNGGMTAAGIPVKTDDRSRGLISDGRALAMADSTYTTKWYGSDGLFYDVDAPTMIQMSAKVAEHTNLCYMAFEQTSAGISGGSITTLAVIDAAYQGF
ncbi:DUF4376 domain-containing protein [Bradyrhizobium sp. 2S1]|uniref:DUF4376 domain-containing protein n=1 Tax=Bradyrhizobium sp. 2S1 TaxID=1404429 RepID=UPI001407DC8C|nr:DUF4376 domain-containing protein [Bradyrhizobium sp. 2S1]MCK7672217.1 DUF4376 domain-containing protein [Bradyrhizobium sp. 2S1]